MNKPSKDTETKKEVCNLQYRFTKDELLILGHDLAEAQTAIRQLEDDRKRVADDWKARISAKEAEINSLSNKVGSGYEYRDIQCEITYNHPKGKKTCIRLDDMSVVWIREMTGAELQRTLKFEEDAKKNEAPNDPK